MLQQQALPLMVVTAALGRAVKVAGVEVQVEQLQEQVELVEPEVNQVAVAAEVVDQLTDQIQAPVAQVVLV